MYATATMHPLLNTTYTDTVFSIENDIAHMLLFEKYLAQVQGEQGIIPIDSARTITTALDAFTPSVSDLVADIAKDGVIVPKLIDCIRNAMPPEHAAYVHFGATSQDVIDTSLCLRLHRHIPTLIQLIDTVQHHLNTIANTPTMAYTRMQPAVKIGWHDKIHIWQSALQDGKNRLQRITLPIQLSGAVGTLSHTQPHVRSALADKLGLSDMGCWHTIRTPILDIAHIISLIAIGFGKMGQDLALMAQMGDIHFKNAGTSSSMPHKNNPIGSEILVTLCDFVCGQHTLLSRIHEQHRSGRAWMLEWITFPQMVVACTCGLHTAIHTLQSLQMPPQGDEQGDEQGDTL